MGAKEAMILTSVVAATTAWFAYLAYCREVVRREKAEAWIDRLINGK